MYERLKALEDRLLLLERISPDPGAKIDTTNEHFDESANNTCVANRKEEISKSLTQINDEMQKLKNELMMSKWKVLKYVVKIVWKSSFLIDIFLYFLQCKKMKIKRQSKVKKILNFYKHNFGHHPPYQMLIDGTFTQACLKVSKTKKIPSNWFFLFFITISRKFFFFADESQH